MANTLTVAGALKGGVETQLRALFDVTLEEVPTAREELWSSRGLITKYRVSHGTRVAARRG